MPPPQQQLQKHTEKNSDVEETWFGSPSSNSVYMLEIQPTTKREEYKKRRHKGKCIGAGRNHAELWYYCVLAVVFVKKRDILGLRPGSL